MLERLTGTPWPETAETDVIETSTPYLRGYAGYYYADTDVIEVGEEFDSHTMLHELSHAWFNDSAMAQRWLSEGLADEIGARAVAELGEPLPTPDDFDIVGDVNRATFHLNAWSYQFDDSVDPTEHVRLPGGVPCAARAVRRDRPGEDGGARRSRDAWRPRLSGRERHQPTTHGAIGWREFLDLAEQIGGSQHVVELYRKHVITPRRRTTSPTVEATVLGLRGARRTRGRVGSAPARRAVGAWRNGSSLTRSRHRRRQRRARRPRRVGGRTPPARSGAGAEPRADYERVDDLEVVLDELNEHERPQPTAWWQRSST